MRIRFDPDRIKNLTDDELKSECVKRIMNGEYAKFICRGCGMVLTDENASTENAKIIAVCKICYEGE